MPLYLGLDCSTQSLTATVIDVSSETRRVVFEHSLEFDTALPHYQTTNGVRRHDDPLVVTSPPLMWVEALDRLMGVLSTQSAFDRSHIAAIGGCAQQHGTVYLNDSAARTIGSLDSAKPLVDQLRDIFSRADSPVWMDESTGPQCAAMSKALGGDDAVARLTGSRAFARFAGPQIRKFYAEQPASYSATRRIHLVSSFMASLLAGVEAPLEPGDAAGMNLMDIRRLRWDPAAMDATAPDLLAKLPPIRESATTVGVLASYWRERYGLPAARVIAWTGDNPSSLVGAGLVREGDLGVSLGTSDTVFGPIEAVPADPGAAHVFGSPTGGYMLLVCFRNGSLAREHIRNSFGLDWAGFSRALRVTHPGNGGAIMLPWVEAEITPPVTAGGVRRIGLSAGDGPANVRAVVEGQMMAMANHWSALAGRPARRIRATGGASQNREILQVMADVFAAEVQPAANTSAASLGAALRAFHAHRRLAAHASDWRDIVAGFTEGSAAPVLPVREHAAIYERLRKRYEELEVQEATESSRMS